MPRTVTLVLVDRSGEAAGVLPAFAVPSPWWQEAAEIVAGADREFGVNVTVLRLLDAVADPHDPRGVGGNVTYLAELDGRVPPSLTRWLGVLDDHPLRAAWARPGGPAADVSWAAEALARLDRQVTGPAEQLRTWNLSSIWRLPTARGTAWLKVVPPFFAHEGGILVALAGAGGNKGCGLPATLVHGDFHPGNLRSDGTSLVLLDWGDCGVGHPLLDLPAFLGCVPEDALAMLRGRWLAAWAAAIPGSDPDRAAELIGPVAALRQAVIYRGFLDGIEPSERRYHAADVPTWLRRAATMV